MSRVLIVGAGVVGEAAGASLEAIGHTVAYHDVDLAHLDELGRRGRTTCLDLSGCASHPPELIFICVDTPNANGAADLSRLDAACRSLGPVLAAAAEYPRSTGPGREYPLVTVKSTILPGTTERRVVPWLEQASGRKAGVDFGVCYWPEFLRHATAEADAREPWIVVIGRAEARSERQLLAALDPLVRRGATRVPVQVTDYVTAEAAKYASNLFNATKISFANEMWRACRKLGVDGNRVMAIVSGAAEGMWNPRYGIEGGRPYSGGCLPKDVQAFLALAKTAGLAMPLLEAVRRVNDEVVGSDSSQPLKS